MYSQAVTHPSTNMAQCCLTSVIRRELVFSTWYGRRQRKWARIHSEIVHWELETLERTGKRQFLSGEMIGSDKSIISGEVGRSWRYCNVRPTRDGAGASSWTPSPYRNLKLIRTDTTLSIRRTGPILLDPTHYSLSGLYWFVGSPLIFRNFP